MIEDMTARKLCAGTQRGHIRSCKRFAAFLKRPPDTATCEDIRRFQLHLAETGMSICNRNRIMTGVRFLFRVTTGDPIGIGSHDLSASTGGGAAGLDYQLSPYTVVGFALGGGGTNWSVAQGLGGGHSDVFQVGVYGITNFDPAYFAASFGYAEHWMRTNREVFGFEFATDFNAHSYGGRAEAGYHLGRPVFTVTPYAAVQAQAFHIPSLIETDVTGNGLGFAFAGRTPTDTRSELGARFDRAVALGSSTLLTLRANVAWAHDWVSDPV